MNSSMTPRYVFEMYSKITNDTRKWEELTTLERDEFTRMSQVPLDDWNDNIIAEICNYRRK